VEQPITPTSVDRFRCHKAVRQKVAYVEAMMIGEHCGQVNTPGGIQCRELLAPQQIVQRPVVVTSIPICFVRVTARTCDNLANRGFNSRNEEMSGNDVVRGTACLETNSK
jgi:hypothetical protein